MTDEGDELQKMIICFMVYTYSMMFTLYGIHCAVMEEIFKFVKLIRTISYVFFIFIYRRELKMERDGGNDVLRDAGQIQTQFAGGPSSYAPLSLFLQHSDLFSYSFPS